MHYNGASSPQNNHSIPIFSPLLVEILILMYYCLFLEEALPCMFLWIANIFCRSSLDYTFILYLLYWESEASPTLGCSIDILRDICM